MANMYWKGGTTAVAQVDDITPGGTIEAGDIFILTVTGENGDTTTVTFAATATTVANVTAGLTAAWNASTHYLCTGITAADGTTKMTLTADTAGVPFTVAATTTESNGDAADDQTIARAASVANAGPYDWKTQANWTGGDADLPGSDASDVIYVDGGTIKYGLNQSAIANALTALYITRSQIGDNGSSGKNPSYLQIKTAKLDINYAGNPGSSTFLSPVNIDTGATACAITVFNSGTNTPTTEPSVNIKAASASSNLYVLKGIVGVANHSGETTTLGTINVSFTTSVNTDAEVYMGSEVILTTYTQKGGDNLLSSAATTLNIEAGTLQTEGSGAYTTVNNTGGTFVSNSTGTITALNISGSGVSDFTKSQEARTVTTLKIDPSGTLKYDIAAVTLTNKVQPVSTTGNIQYYATAI